MSSYTSSFKAVLAALLMIVAAEFGYSAVAARSPVERSGYLNWNFNEPELFHKALIYAKLRNAAAAKPAIIQVGDSSGLHGIVPAIVEKYVPGLRYENLSCCANTGFDGYYNIAQFMLRHALSIKAVVLYITWNNIALDPAQMGPEVVGGPDRLRNAFGQFSSLTSPPTLAARENVLRSVYTLDRTLNPLASMPFDDRWAALLPAIRDHQGWMMEQDLHRIPSRQAEMLKKLCGDAGRKFGSADSARLTHDIFGRPRSFMEVELSRLAQLTARHHAKLIVMFQPHPCQLAADDEFVSMQRSEIAAIAAEYPNVVVPAAASYEHWSGQMFTSADHLRTGYEDLASRRVGRAVAKALDISFVEKPAAPSVAAPHTVWSMDDFPSPPWRYDNIRLMPKADGGGTVATETATEGWHRVEMTLPDLPAKTYVLSVTFGTKGPRQLSIFMRDLQLPGAQGAVHCNTATGESFANGGVLDWGIEELPGKSFRCLARLTLTKTGGVLGFGLARAGYNTGPYLGDGKSNIVIHGISLSAVDEARQ